MRVTVQIPRMDAERQAYYLQSLLNLQAQANAVWYLEQWSRDIEPGCCAQCAGVLYLEPGKSFEQTFHSAEQVLADPGRGWSCADIAALDAGAQIAREIRAGGSGTTIRVALEQVGTDRWHAVVVTPEGVSDPSQKVQAVGYRRARRGAEEAYPRGPGPRAFIGRGNGIARAK